MEFKFSFIICVHSARIDNLIQTIHFLTDWHPDVIRESQLLIAWQDDYGKITTDQMAQLILYGKQFGHHVEVNLNMEFMQFAYMNNKAVEFARSDRLVFLESDRILPRGYFASVLDQLQPKTAITCKSMKKLTKLATNEEIEAGSFEFNDEVRSETNEIGARNLWSGNTLIMKSDFEEAGGMDEGYTGYGWTDNDMTNRTAKIGVRPIFRPEVELHLWHPSETYGSGDRKKMFLDGGLRYCKTWSIEPPEWLRNELSQRKKRLL